MGRETESEMTIQSKQPFEEITATRLENYKLLLEDEYRSPLGMYIKHEGGVRCSQCGLLALAFEVFDKRGWPIPESMIGMYNRRKPDAASRLEEGRQP